MPPSRKQNGPERQKTREEDEQFRTLFAEAPIAYHEVDREGIIQRVNRAETELLGFRAEEMLGRPVWEFVAEDERESSRAAVRRKLRGEQPLAPFRRTFTRHDGTRRTVEIHENLIHDRDGKISGLRSALLDVTARREAEEAARRAHEELETRVEARTAELARANQALESQISERRSAEQRLALQYAAIRALTESAGLETAATRILEALCRYLYLDFGTFWLLEGDELTCRVFWGVAPASGLAARLRQSKVTVDKGLLGKVWGEGRPSSASGALTELIGQAGGGGEAIYGLAFPVVAGARPHGLIAVFGKGAPERESDLLQTLQLLGRQMGDFIDRKAAETALQESQRRFSTFMAHLPGIAFMKDERGRYVYISPAVECFIGVPPENILNHTDDDLFPAEAALLSRETDGYVVRTRKPTEGLQELPVRGKTRSWLVYKFPILEPETRAVMIGGVAVDVTERKLLEDQLRHAQRMEAMGRLAGGVAHDFNNILTIIGGYGRMVLEQLPPEDSQHATLQTMLDAADRAAVLTGQLLAFSRRQVVQLKLLDLNKVVAGVEKMLRRVIGEHIELRTSLDMEIAPVKADAGQMDQVLMNLAVNARDAMPDGGKLLIETAHDSGQVRLSVTDTGVGMNEEVKTRAFEPFFTTKGRGKGTGLGLSMVYGIVRQHGGDIKLESEPGAGTRFDIILPAATEQTEPAPAPAHKRPARQGTETILLVEDETAVRRLAADILKSSGYRVMEAGDGMEALRVVETATHRIHLLLTDLVMPHMGGRELANEVRKQWSGIRVLFMSGYTDDVIHADVARAANFLPKPFTPDVLLQKVRETLDNSSTHTNRAEPGT